MKSINTYFNIRSRCIGCAVALLLTIMSSASLADQPGLPHDFVNKWSSSAGKVIDDTSNPSFEFKLTSPKYVEIKLENKKGAGCTTDPYLYLIDEHGEIIMENDDHSSDSSTSECIYDSKITSRLNQGNYTLVAGTYKKDDVGDFVLSIREINNKHKVCYDKWNPSAGKTSTSQQNPRKILRLIDQGEITIDLKSSVDTYLYLLDPSGAVIEEDDDDGDGRDSQIIFNTFGTLKEGDYQLVAGTYRDNQWGDFTLSVEFDEDDKSSQLICNSQSISASNHSITSSLTHQSNFYAGADISKTYVNLPFRQIASGGSGIGAITYSSSNTAIATVDASSGRVTINGVGTTQITASKAADNNYHVAHAYYTLTVTKASQTIAFAEGNHTATFGNNLFSNILTGTKGNGALTYTSSNPSIARVDNSGNVTIKGAGTIQITVTKAGDSNYYGASASYTITVKKASQTIEFTDDEQRKKVGDKPFSNILTGTKGPGEITYTSSNSSIASVDNSGNVTIKGAGTIQITASKAADNNYHVAHAYYTLTVTKASQTIAFAEGNHTATFGNNLFSNILTGTKGNGALTYTSSNPSIARVDNSGNVTIKGAGTIQITVTKAGDSNYYGASASYTITVKKASQTIEFTDDEQRKKVGDKPFSNILTGTKGPGEITYTSSNSSIASVDNSGNVTIKGAGTIQITASKAADSNNHGATDQYQLHISSAGIARSQQIIQLNLMPIRERSTITGSFQADIESSNHLSYSIDDEPHLGQVKIDPQTGAFSYSLFPESDTPSNNHSDDSFSIAIKKANQLIANEDILIEIKTDPEYKDQWELDGYIKDYFTGEMRKGWHINIAEPISDGLTGQGVIVAVVDNGIKDVPDLEFDKQNSWDFQNNGSNVADGKRFLLAPESPKFHGTRVARVLAATGWNDTGGRGVAPGVTVRAYFMTGTISSTLGGHHESKDVDIFNMSYITNSMGAGTYSLYDQHLWYGLSEPYACDMDKNGSTDCPWVQKYKQGLRDGKGAIYIKGAGNAFHKTIGLMTKACRQLARKYQLPCQTTIIDSSTNHPGLIVVAATNKAGSADYSNHGPANWISAPSDYGTSFSAPRVAGVVALMLEANPELSWRDVKYILANSARQVDNDEYKWHRRRGAVTVDDILLEPGWITNQAVRQWHPEKSAWQQPNGGYKFHNAYGFGLVDGAKAVTMAKNYPENHLGDFIKYPEHSNEGLNDKLETRTRYQYTINQTSDGLAEAVRVNVKVDYDYITDLSIILESPSGTQSTLLTPFNGIRHIKEGHYLELSSNAFYGESIQGEWTLKIFDHLDDNTDADKHDPLTLADNSCKNFNWDDAEIRCVRPITGNAQFKGWKLFLYGRDKPAE